MSLLLAIMNVNELIGLLEKELHETLPGEKAHKEMHARLPNGGYIKINHQDPPRKSGVMILLYEKDGLPCFPLIQRPSYPGVHSGQMAFPGGKYEDEDENLVQTALRETQEEIGITSDKIQVIGLLSEMHVVASNYDILPVIGCMSDNPNFIPDPKEVEELITPTVAQLLSPEKRKEKEINVRTGVNLIAPYFDLENKVVWGATAMILNELKSIISRNHLNR